MKLQDPASSKERAEFFCHYSPRENLIGLYSSACRRASSEYRGDFFEVNMGIKEKKLLVLRRQARELQRKVEATRTARIFIELITRALENAANGEVQNANR